MFAYIIVCFLDNQRGRDMAKGKGTTDLSKYLAEMEEVKKQYQQYVEISQIYKLPIFQPDPKPQYDPPSDKNPLTINEIVLAK